MQLTRTNYADAMRGYVASRKPFVKPHSRFYELGRRIMSNPANKNLDDGLAKCGYTPPPRPHPTILPPAPDRPDEERQKWFSDLQEWLALDATPREKT